MKTGISPAVAVIVIVIVIAIVVAAGWMFTQKKGPKGDQPQGPDSVKAMMKQHGMDQPQTPAGKGPGTMPSGSGMGSGMGGAGGPGAGSAGES